MRSETCFYCKHADFKAESNSTMRGFAKCTKAAPDVGVLMRESARKANQAFTLLSPAYWNTGAAKRVYEELGLKWTF